METTQDESAAAAAQDPATASPYANVPFAAYSPVLRLAEELMPGGAAVILVLAALSFAVIIHSFVSAPSKKAPPAGRRRGKGCDLALEPDGSRDKSNRAWRRELSPQVYASLREGVTDPPNLSMAEGGFDDDERLLEADGIFVCAGCRSELYDNDTRFEAGCGWPCFFTSLPGAVRERHDLDGERMELICNACNGQCVHEMPPRTQRPPSRAT